MVRICGYVSPKAHVSLGGLYIGGNTRDGLGCGCVALAQCPEQAES